MKPIEIHQLFEPDSCTYTYLLIDPDTREAALIDSVLETAERDLETAARHSAKLKYVLDTHIHADHVTGAGVVRDRTGARTGVSVEAGVECADLQLQDGQVLPLGESQITVMATPGHTNSCLSFLIPGAVFTGDALLIGTAGRTDFQSGSAQKLYHSITQKLFKLPPETVLYPGHDYRDLKSSTIGEEILANARAGGGRSEADFVKLMSELNLAAPRKMSEALPANLRCGRKSSEA